MVADGAKESQPLDFLGKVGHICGEQELTRTLENRQTVGRIRHLMRTIKGKCDEIEKFLAELDIEKDNR